MAVLLTVAEESTLPSLTLGSSGFSLGSGLSFGSWLGSGLSSGWAEGVGSVSSGFSLGSAGCWGSVGSLTSGVSVGLFSLSLASGSVSTVLSGSAGCSGLSGRLVQAARESIRARTRTRARSFFIFFPPFMVMIRMKAVDFCVREHSIIAPGLLP